MEYPLWYCKDTNTQEILPQEALQLVHKVTEGNAIVTTDVGQRSNVGAAILSFK